MESWARTALRLLAVANILQSLVGFYHVQLSATILAELRASNPSRGLSEEYPHLFTVYHTMFIINLSCLTVLFISAFYVWRLHGRGRTICNVLFIFEVAYWAGMYGIRFALLEWGNWGALLLRGTISFTHAFSNAGLSTQYRTLYPLIGLVVLNLAYSRMGHATKTRASTSA